MKEQNTLSEARIAIVGLGLMGGSLALALKSKCEMVLGVDTDPETIAYALEKGIVDQASIKIDSLIHNANVVILAVPVSKIIEIIGLLPVYHPGNAIVMDIGSTKREILAAFKELPERFDPIGGHPMCGKENLAIFNADPHMFQNAVFAITALERTTESTQNFAVQVASAIGSRPLIIDPVTHDKWTAATSHLPFLLSLALSLSTPSEVAPLVGPGFRSTVRLAGTPKSMMLDILHTNRDEVLNQCKNYLSQLTEIKDLIEAEEFEKLSELMEKGKVRKEFFTTGGKN